MPTALKDMVGSEVVADVAERFARQVPGFDAAGFTQRLENELPDLELKARIAAIADAIRHTLGGTYPEALAHVLAVAREEPLIDGFAAWPLCTFVERFGLDEPELSLDAMETLTQRASCEFAIRPYLDAHWDVAYAKAVEFATSEDEHVRRLASEGLRPRLPWGARVSRLVDDPQPGLTILDHLKTDPSETVRRSVANHLNDIAKDHPGLVVDTVARWSGEPAIDLNMLHHALRTLVKQGDPAALEALGFVTEPAVAVASFTVAPPRVALGERIELRAELRSTSSDTQRLVVDFVIHHVAADGSLSPKVFKWANLELAAGEAIELRKRRLIQQQSTRTYRSGTHVAELQVAGRRMGRAEFDVDAG